MDNLSRVLREHAEPLPDADSDAFARLFDRFGKARVVLIGESSHGTHEFYRARAAITRRLISHHGFSIVAVEADWPDADKVDRCVRGRDSGGWHETAFTRFPTWMWRNTDVQAFARWLHGHNQTLPAQQRVEFRGLDVYSLRSSIREVLGYLEDTDPSMARDARQRYACLTPWHNDPALYGHFTERRGMSTCESEVVEQLRQLLDQRLAWMGTDSEALFNATQNARVIRAAEQYYRAMYRGSTASWNLRDRHMFETLQAVRSREGRDTKAVVWAHNSHVGDARATQMGDSGQLTLGQLCRETCGADCVLIGMGTDQGTVAAASDWDSPMRIQTVVPALPQSWERAFVEAGPTPALYDWLDNPPLRQALSARLLERAIGVIYQPRTERQSHYFESTLSEQFDAWLWFAHTQAVTPLAAEASSSHEQDTFPFGT